MDTLLGLMTGKEISMDRRVTLNEQTLEDFCNSEHKTMKIEMCSIRYAVDIAKEVDPSSEFEVEGDEINGWQVDFWYTINCLGNRLTLSGSLHYGDFKLTKESGDD